MVVLEDLSPPDVCCSAQAGKKFCYKCCRADAFEPGLLTACVPQMCLCAKRMRLPPAFAAAAAIIACRSAMWGHLGLKQKQHAHGMLRLCTSGASAHVRWYCMQHMTASCG